MTLNTIRLNICVTLDIHFVIVEKNNVKPHCACYNFHTFLL